MKADIFDQKYRALNARQKEAVDAIEGPVMVIAGPGTGKTTILTLRIANILRATDTPPSGILAITYTEEAAKNMRRKLREIIGSRADEVRIHTFHGFAAAVISEFDDHFPHLSRSKQLSEPEAEELIRTILAGKKFAKLRPLGDPDFYVKKILGTISDAKREAWTPEMIADFVRDEAERVRNDESSISTRGATKGKLKGDAEKRIERCERTALFAEAYSTYEKKKREEGKMDFDDLIFELSQALRSDELLLRQLQEKFLYILVDEHQDTNDSQNAVIRALADFFEDPNLFVVGDEKQAIYRFQGASVENFLRFQDVWKSMRVIPLEENYRSHQGILDATFSLIEHNYDEGALESLRVRLRAGGKDGPKPIDIVSAGNAEAAETYLADALKQLSPKETAAVIVRTNRDAARVASALESRGISASAERTSDAFLHPAGLLFFELIRYLSDPSQIESLAYTVAGGLWNLSFEDGTALVRAIRGGDISSIPRVIPALLGLREESSKAGSISFIMHAAEVSGLVRLAARDPLSMEVWRTLVSLSYELALRDPAAADDPQSLMDALLSYKASAESRGVKIASGSAETPIRIMTAHSSKGLEFDKVFVMYATEESWMSQGRPSYFVMPRERDEGDGIRDARRLFYVALTRAKAHAAVISPLEEEDGRALSPVRFISELDPAHISRIEIPARHENAFDPRAGRGEEDRLREKIEYAKRTILEKGLSVTALNHFVKCPSEFYFKSILKVPEAPSPSSEKGVAMHQALSKIWTSEVKDAKGIEAILAEETAQYLRESLLSAAEKERITEELRADAPAVAAALLGHFSLGSGSAVSTERWFEAPIDVKLGTEHVPVRLHGRLDAVIDGADKVLVFDYKTREGMSEAEIRGETKATKDGKGVYFRQLAFYAFLLGAHPAFSGKSIEPSLVFVRPDKKGKCPVVTIPVRPADIEKVISEARELVAAVWSGNLFKGKCADEKCEWCSLIYRG